MKYSIFALLLTSLFFFGCAQDELTAEQEETQNQEVYTVSLKFSGDIQTEDSPLSRAETDSRDLYGIQVYRDGKYFAAGMFDNTNNITIDLLAGSSYKFVCTAIKEGKNICYYHSNEDIAYGACYPYSYGALYCEKGGVLWQNSNSFYYSTNQSYSLWNLSGAYIYIGGNSQSNISYCAQIDRFYGEVSDYAPSVNGVVNLDLKRVSFGIKLKVTNLQEGKVSVTCKNEYNTFISASNLTADYETEGTVYSMANIYSAWRYASTGYTENLTLTVTWNREEGLISDSWTKTVQVKRNAMNVISIKMGADEIEGVSTGVTLEEEEMGSEEEEISLE